MTPINDIYAHGSLTKTELMTFIRILSPFAPHVAEEMWEELGGKGYCSLAAWPEWDESKTIDSTVEIPVQICGKLKFTIDLPADMGKDEAIAAAKADDRIKPFIDGKTIIKEICVPGKIINIVVK